jgi:DNA-binding NtrC family response regulator
MIEEQERGGVAGWDPKALELLQSYEWPGNVRELRNIVHRAYVMTEGKIIRPEVVQSLLPRGARSGVSTQKKKQGIKQKSAAVVGRKK